MHRSLSPALFVLGSLLATPPAQAGESYTFKVNGEVVTPPVLTLSGAPDKPQPGDLVLIDDILLTLGPDTNYEFRTTPEADGRLLAVAPGGRTHVVGVKTGWTYRGDEKVVIDPLGKLTAEEVRGLRGVRLDGWPDRAEDRLKFIDVNACCVTVTDAVARGDAKTLPPLPAGLRYLQIDERSNHGIRDHAPLGGLTDLTFLRVRSLGGPFDAAAVKGATKLRHLDLTGCELRNAPALASLKELRYLSLAHCEGLDAVAFARGMAALARLDVRGTGVADLTTLEGLDRLAAVAANQSPVRVLPAGGLPGLRKLEVMFTRLTDAAVADFRRTHPGCEVLFRWNAALDDRLRGATRVRVRSGGTCHRRPAAEKTLFEVTGAAEVAAVTAGLRVEEDGDGFHCMCCGEPSLEFYKGDELVATLGFHHGRSVRWPDVWPADGMLTPAAADALCRWLADHGLREPLAERERGKKQEASARRRGDAIPRCCRRGSSRNSARPSPSKTPRRRSRTASRTPPSVPCSSSSFTAATRVRGTTPTGWMNSWRRSCSPGWRRGH